MKRSVWERAARQYDQYVTHTTNGFLREFMLAEQRLLEEAIRNGARKGGKVTVLEIGCGTGRTLFEIAENPSLARLVQYLIGIDSALAMWNIANHKLGEYRTGGTPPDPLGSKFLFLRMRAESLSRYFSRGRVTWQRVRKLAGNNDALSYFDPGWYQASRKVICNLLNTLGVMDERTRAQSIENMVRAAGQGDFIVLSLFDAAYFPSAAPSLYSTLPFVGRIEEGSFGAHEFRTATYYSHWFTAVEVAEVERLLTGLGCELAGRRSVGPGGYFVTAVAS